MRNLLLCCAGFTFAISAAATSGIASSSEGAAATAGAGSEAGAIANAANASPNPSTSKTKTESSTAALEAEIQQLRDMLASQTQRIEAQNESLKAEQERVNALERQLVVLKASTTNLPEPSAATAGDTNPVSLAPPGGDNSGGQPAVIPAIAPIRPLPVGGMQKGELKPAFTIGSVNVTPYGFIKATFVHDSSSPYGDDFPLPGFSADTGPTAAPEFHVKARSTRLGAKAEWRDSGDRITITGKIEFDFEGNFTRVDNRNLSSIRSSDPSIRLAYGRMDYKAGGRDTLSALFGQDWTPFGSSTLPDILETTGTATGFGGLWERDPQMRFGWTHDFGSFKVMPEFAIVMPASGETPNSANLSNQLGYGERQGADSGQPGIQVRAVLQWQLDPAPGVAPAQLIVSGEHGRREAIVLAAAVPSAYTSAFPTGARVGSDSDAWTGEWQLPTRFATVAGKYYAGSDLRWFLAGQLFSNFNDTLGLTNIQTASSIDGSSTVAFGLRSGFAVVAPQRPVRGAGGFTSLGLPLSRIFDADPQGRNGGWTINFTYGTDEANTHDLLRLDPAGSRARSDMSVGTLNYKLNKWVAFSFEQSLYRTRANTAASGLPLFMGRPQHEWKDLRAEGGTIFSF
jgi:hypothetical protein